MISQACIAQFETYMAWEKVACLIPHLAIILLKDWKNIGCCDAGFSPEIFEGVVAFSGVVKLGSIANVTQSAT